MLTNDGRALVGFRAGLWTHDRSDQEHRPVAINARQLFNFTMARKLIKGKKGQCPPGGIIDMTSLVDSEDLIVEERYQPCSSDDPSDYTWQRGEDFYETSDIDEPIDDDHVDGDWIDEMIEQQEQDDWDHTQDYLETITASNRSQ
ncbi:unnamed protein product [Durusdinium trenchii]|uniref:Uncharacterized protein n=1 Tax=Durusdinium trenchii TaxID=1381693 RepID=A0ABP0QHI8_9DINO